MDKKNKKMKIMNLIILQQKLRMIKEAQFVLEVLWEI